MNRLKSLRQESGLSLRKLQQHVGIDFSHLAKIEKNDINIEMVTLNKLADFFNVSTSFLLGNDGFMKFYYNESESSIDLAYLQFKETISKITPTIEIKDNKIIRLLSIDDYKKIIDQFNLERDALNQRIKINKFIDYLDSLKGIDYQNAKEIIEDYFVMREFK